MFTRAIVRKPGKNFAQGLTTTNLGSADYSRMMDQHQAYVQALLSLGLDVIVLDPLKEYPDAYFVEDTAVVMPEVAVITNPGAPSRRGEEEIIQPVLAGYRKTTRIQPPGTMEGGDVLMAGRHFFIGVSARTNEEGAAQFGRIVARYGYTSMIVPVGQGLHLKSSVNGLGDNTLLITEEFSKMEYFKGYDQVVLDNDEAYASNTLFVNGMLIMPAGFPRTKAQLQALGLPIMELDVSEARKMDGGLTCMSLRF